MSRSPRSDDHGRRLCDCRDGRLTRRQLIVRAGALGLYATTLGHLLAACGDDDAEPAASPAPSAAADPQGTAVLLNFPGWIGETELKDFSREFPGAKVKMSTNLPNSIAGVVQLIKNNPGAYDMALGDPAFVGQAKAAGVYQEPDWSLLPNLAKVDRRFRDAYPDAPPTDWGMDVLAYRKDIVEEAVTSWADFWALAPKYSGQLVIEDLDRATIAMALKYLGHSGNSTNEEEIRAAGDALIELKPHLQAVTSVGAGSGLAKGTIAMAHCINYEAAFAQGENENVAWVIPAEGTFGYVEGFVPLLPSEHLDVVHAFLDFHLSPEVYAGFINTTGSAWVMPAAEEFLDQGLLDTSALRPTAEQLDQVEWTKYIGEATVIYGQVWQEFKAA